MIEDHPLRFELANELHARPFPALKAPARAIVLALKPADKAANRDKAAVRAHLLALLDRYGAPHPPPNATHYFGEIGKHRLKWESHTEFDSYTVFFEGLGKMPFDPDDFSVFPADWLEAAPGIRMTSIMVRAVDDTDEARIEAALDEWFVPESLAVSAVLDQSMVIAGDFRIDPAGHQRFALFCGPEIGDRRQGRVAQRLAEIETYKSMSMLGLARARALSVRMGELDGELTRLMAEMSARETRAEDTLDGLLSISAELETLLAQSSFRFGATGAYEAIVNQRVEVLRETPFRGRQSFAEFMMRRFDPAMRTVKSTQTRLGAMAERAARAGDLLRTRVDVERSAQNQALLASMDRRADLQLRLQKTVEGLSVVAISYYAVNLVLYVLGPLAYGLGLSKIVLGAMVTPLVVLAVWLTMHRIRKSMD